MKNIYGTHENEKLKVYFNLDKIMTNRLELYMPSKTLKLIFQIYTNNLINNGIIFQVRYIYYENVFKINSLMFVFYLFFIQNNENSVAVS